MFLYWLVGCLLLAYTHNTDSLNVEYEMWRDRKFDETTDSWGTKAEHSGLSFDGIYIHNFVSPGIARLSELMGPGIFASTSSIVFMRHHTHVRHWKRCRIWWFIFDVPTLKHVLWTILKYHTSNYLK
jgi:hypothetical protein